MTPALWITTAGIILAAVVTLWVNASNRAQQRQIELWKKDPSVPIKPPPHPVLIAAKSYGPALISICISVYYLYKDVTNPAQLTRRDVLTMAFEVGAIVFMLNFMLIMFLVRSLGDVLLSVVRAFFDVFKSGKT
jgi:hypothetical protein